MFFKTGVPKKIQKFHCKTPVLSLLTKIAGSQGRGFIKKRLQHSSFPMEFSTFSRTPYFAEQLR